MSFLLKDYHFELPQDLIAQVPIEPRDHSRLLYVDRKSGKIEHLRFDDLPRLLQPRDRLFANHTRVIRARLLGRRWIKDFKNPSAPESLGGKVELLLLKEVSPRVWECACHCSAEQKAGLKFGFEISSPERPDALATPPRLLNAKMLKGARESASGTVVVEFDVDPLGLEVGEIPLPHYIESSERPLSPTERERYQTTYSDQGFKRGARDVSSAAPTAGLHFTPELKASLAQRGVGWSELTLAVGLGTFRPVKVQDIREHQMHSERFWIPEQTAQEYASVRRDQGERVIAVGTTSLRTLESAWSPGLRAIRAGEGETYIFIYPGGRPIESIDGLITNFHLPESTLLMLVSSFLGREKTLEVYREAVLQKYRFFSFGDAMVIL
jgi:S-adenosylmethionine:tRNA ribosyltransferase-isomerase